MTTIDQQPMRVFGVSSHAHGLRYTKRLACSRQSAPVIRCFNWRDLYRCYRHRYHAPDIKPYV